VEFLEGPYKLEKHTPNRMELSTPKHGGFAEIVVAMEDADEEYESKLRNTAHLLMCSLDMYKLLCKLPKTALGDSLAEELDSLFAKIEQREKYSEFELWYIQYFDPSNTFKTFRKTSRGEIYINPQMNDLLTAFNAGKSTLRSA
jgi:hypothetical protein